MVKNQVLIEIPIEIFDVVFRVEKTDPLRPIMDSMELKKVPSKLNAVHRLAALSTSHTELSKDIEFPALVVRDLWKGKYWTTKERNLDVEKNMNLQSVRIPQIGHTELSAQKENVKEIAKPFLGWLANASQIEKKEIIGHIRLDELTSKGGVIYLRTLISQREDKTGRKFWVHEEGPFKQLITEYIEEIPGFEMTEEAVRLDDGDWPYAPELEALAILKNGRASRNRILKLFDEVIDNINNDDRPRLQWVRQRVGFRQDMWDAAVDVMDSAKKNIFALTSFTNVDYLKDITELFSSALGGSDKQILLSIGNPNRGRSPEDIPKTNEFIQSLSNNENFECSGGISPQSTHAKLIVSDTGSFFIGSCNLLSGSFESGTLESGLFVKDSRCSKEILQACLDGGWVPKEQISTVENMRDCLSESDVVEPCLNQSIVNQLSKIKHTFEASNRRELRGHTLRQFEHLLRRISERPIWSLLRENEHRPFMEDCIHRFKKRIVLASDGLRSNGLDKASIQKISQQAKKNRATVHVWWGRHAPNSKPYDEADKRGRKEAKERLTQLRELSGKGKEWRILPRHSSEPMESHAKMFIVDDMRLLITSDNTLSFGDTIRERGDAGELGLVIDHPRVAIQTRGSMELWLPPDAITPGDMTRWWAALGEEVGFLTTRNKRKFVLEDALDAMIQRITSNPHLENRWKMEVENENDEPKILRNLAKGMNFGMYTLLKTRNSKKPPGSKISPSQNVIALYGKAAWEVNQNESVPPENFSIDVEHFIETYREELDHTIDNVLLAALSDYKSKSGKREHLIKQGKRSYKFKPPNKLSMRFQKKFVHGYLEKERTKIENEFQTQHGLTLDLDWPVSKQMRTPFQLEADEEVTPAIWAEAFIHYMANPDEFEWASDVIRNMTTQHPQLKLGPGKAAKYITEQCGDYLETERRDMPAKNSLYTRRRAN